MSGAQGEPGLRASIATGDADWPALSARNLARNATHGPRTMGQRIAEWDDAWAADAASPSPYLNCAALLRSPNEDAAGVVGRLAAFYDGGLGSSWMLWSAWPGLDLAPFGMRIVARTPLMVHAAGAPSFAPPVPDLRIVEVGDASTLGDFEAVVIAGYPVPELSAAAPPRLYDTRALGGPLHLFVGYAGEEPVTVAASYVDERTVGIYAVATLPAARGKGYGAAITTRARQVAPSLPAVLEASDDGRPVYHRLGFQSVAEDELWIRPRFGDADAGAAASI